MRIVVTILLGLALAGGAMAQDGSKAVKTIKITGPLPPSVVTLYRVEDDGTARITGPLPNVSPQTNLIKLRFRSRS